MEQDHKDKLLLAAIYQNSVVDAEEALKLGAQVNKELKCFRAGAYMKRRPLQLLIENYVIEPSRREMHVWHPINTLERDNALKIMSLLIEFGADVNFIVSYKQYFLLESVAYNFGSFHVTNMPGDNDYALHMHIRFEKLFQLLLESGAKLTNFVCTEPFKMICWAMRAKLNVKVVYPVFNRIFSMFLFYIRPYSITWSELERTIWEPIMRNFDLILLLYCTSKKSNVLLI